MSQILTLDDLLKMDKKQIKNVFLNGHPLDYKQMEGYQYLGIDVGMPKWFHKYFWKTFRKTFYRDPETQVLRGWNVRMEQTGIDGKRITKKKKDGSDFTFAHYHVQSAKGLKFPKGWQGSDFLNYKAGENTNAGEAAGYTPLVAINEGDMNLLLGWEVLKFGPLFIPMSDYWILVKDGPIEKVVLPPKKQKK